jgi:hypothetical protein
VKNLWFAWAVERHLSRSPYDVVIGLSRTWSQDILRVGGGPQDIFNRLTLPAHGQSLARTLKALRRALSPSGAVIRWMEARQFDTPSNPAQRVVCVSALVRGWLLEAHPALDPASVEVVYNRPDLSRFAPPDAELRERLRAAQGWADADVVVCTAGTNFALKGVGTRIRALPLLPRNYRLAVAGGRHPDAWVALAKRLGVGERVHFAGKVDDMPAFYAAADVFALPTYYDACSNAVLEALACGLPAISSARNGSAVFADPRLCCRTRRPPGPGPAHPAGRRTVPGAALPVARRPPLRPAPLHPDGGRDHPNKTGTAMTLDLLFLTPSGETLPSVRFRVLPFVALGRGAALPQTGGARKRPCTSAWPSCSPCPGRGSWSSSKNSSPPGNWRSFAAVARPWPMMWTTPCGPCTRPRPTSPAARPRRPRSRRASPTPARPWTW